MKNIRLFTHYNLHQPSIPLQFLICKSQRIRVIPHRLQNDLPIISHTFTRINQIPTVLFHSQKSYFVVVAEIRG